jgi:hypothetical protein
MSEKHAGGMIAKQRTSGTGAPDKLAGRRFSGADWQTKAASTFNGAKAEEMGKPRHILEIANA